MFTARLSLYSRQQELSFSSAHTQHAHPVRSFKIKHDGRVTSAKTFDDDEVIDRGFSLTRYYNKRVNCFHIHLKMYIWNYSEVNTNMTILNGKCQNKLFFCFQPFSYKPDKNVSFTKTQLKRFTFNRAKQCIIIFNTFQWFPFYKVTIYAFYYYTIDHYVGIKSEDNVLPDLFCLHTLFVNDRQLLSVLKVGYYVARLTVSLKRCRQWMPKLPPITVRTSGNQTSHPAALRPISAGGWSHPTGTLNRQMMESNHCSPLRLWWRGEKLLQNNYEIKTTNQSYVTAFF